MNGNLITVIVVTLSAVLTYLLGQPSGTFDPGLVLVFGALNVALTAVSRFLPAQNQPIPVAVTSVPGAAGPDEE